MTTRADLLIPLVIKHELPFYCARLVTRTQRAENGILSFVMPILLAAVYPGRARFAHSFVLFADCFGMNGGGNYMPSLSLHSPSHCLPSPSRISPRSPVSTAGSESGERYSRKVFVGGLPPDIDEGTCAIPAVARSMPLIIIFPSLLGARQSSEEINASFRRFGSLVVDWPHKAESKSYFPPKGYAFLLFQVRARRPH